MGGIKTDYEKLALSYLPERIKAAAERVMSSHIGETEEIRLRAGCAASLVVMGENIPLGLSCTREELGYTLRLLCESSLYSYAEDIKGGVISSGGIRAGVCGRAVVSDGEIKCVRDITSISLRIPHRIRNRADFLLPLAEKYRRVLIYSKPGGGKTTLLRELIPPLAGKHRVAVVDTRYELYYAAEGMCDVLLGYPRYEGMMSAIRSLSPEFILCDELSSSSDAEAVRLAVSTGVGLVATAHAADMTELRHSGAVSSLTGAFALFCGIRSFDEPPELTVGENV